MNYFFSVVLFFIFFLPHSVPLSAQSGCTDPQALNYLPGASSNDGSCTYPVTNYAPLVKATLSSELNEISGLVRAGGYWWCHADSGNPAEFYQILPETGGLPQKVKLKNADNQDWEDIASDGSCLYIGDFGNNKDDRQDLGIYRCPISTIGTDNTESVNDDEWAFLPFHYLEQTDFSSQPADSVVYDCEAMVFFNGAPHLFTKNRKEGISTHYVVNTTDGLAIPQETFNTQGLITGASVSPDGKVVMLLGYELSGVPKIFCWLLWDWHDGLFFNGNKRRIELGNVFTIGQAEAVGFGSNRSGYIANERVVVNGITITLPRTYAFDISAYVPETLSTGEAGNAEEVRLLPNPFFQTVRLPAYDAVPPDYLYVYNASGQRIFQTTTWPTMLHTSTWLAGTYIFSWGWPGHNVVKKMVKQ